MNKERKKKEKMNILMLDTETANEIECPLCYDIGFAVCDLQGNIKEEYSFVIAEIFFDKGLMSSAYFADKIPNYWTEIKEGKRKIAKLNTVRKIIHSVMYKYDCNIVVAHNVRFDYRSTNTTQRLLTCSKYRYFFPYGTKFVDTLKLSRLILGQDENYIKFCNKNEFLCKNGKPRFTAEVIYRFLIQDLEFEESHTGLEDCKIEKEILATCLERGGTLEMGLLW